MNRSSTGNAIPRRKLKHLPPGTSPGVIRIPEGSLTPKIKSFLFNADGFEERELHTVEEIRGQLKQHADWVHWIDIRGFGSRDFLEALADALEIHRLQMEDVVNVYQRPKAEELHNYLFLISRVIRREGDGLVNDQLSIFLGKNFVITIQDRYDDLLDPVRERIRNGKGFLRKSGSDYLTYAIMDTVLDNFFPLLEDIGEMLDELEEELIDNPSRDAMNQLLHTKREMIMLRRAVWAERDKINDIIRSGFLMISEPTKLFFRDSYDHCIQIIDLVESYKEITSNMMDVFMSSMSNRMNQVMKILTIISTIFIPLTFIVGLYGMNFARVDPETGRKLPLNMPELYTPHGYVTVLIIMAVIVILQIIFYYRKGWLTK